MLKKNLLNLFLLILFTSLATIIYFSKEESVELDKLTNTDAESVSNITIRHNGTISKIKKLHENYWEINQPINIAANNFRISSLLKLLSAPVHKRYNDDEIDLTKIGLADSATEISFDDISIRFGDINPVTNLRFLAYGKHVYTIEDVYYPLLSSNFGTLVSLQLLPSNITIEKLILLNQTIAKDGQGRWQSNLARSADAISETLTDWRTIQAFGVHTYLKREDLGEVFIYTEQREKPIRFLITDIDPWLILARPELGIEYHLDISAYNKLLKPE